MFTSPLCEGNCRHITAKRCLETKYSQELVIGYVKRDERRCFGMSRLIGESPLDIPDA